jgi:hypothetical protein
VVTASDRAHACLKLMKSLISCLAWLVSDLTAQRSPLTSVAVLPYAHGYKSSSTRVTAVLIVRAPSPPHVLLPHTNCLLRSKLPSLFSAPNLKPRILAILDLVWSSLVPIPIVP